MEPDRVEMSVGNGAVNGDHLVNGTTANGSSISTKLQSASSSNSRPENAGGGSHTNGELTVVKEEAGGSIQHAGSILHDAPPELLQALSSEFYLPMARLVSRSAQSCWNDLSMLVERLANMHVPAPNGLNATLTINDQSKPNLDKKDLLLNFAKEHKDVFIKLLVLLQWSRRSEEVRKTIELNLWLQQRRQAFNNATGVLGAMLRGLADSQIPNPDLYTATEILATGRVSSLPKLGYVPQPPLTAKQILRVLGRLDVILCTRMALCDDLPSRLRHYHIHDGRVTFTVLDEFSFDVSVASEDPGAKFGMVDFAFLFSPTPPIPDGLHEEITYIANTKLDKDGFTGVYDFLHDLTLSYKLNEFTKQIRRLSQGLWNGHLRVEMLKRTLVVQYWLRSSLPKSWLEIGIHSGKGADNSDAPRQPRLRLRWLREGKLTDSSEINMNLSQLSIEDILRQVVAQHTNHMFDAIYDRLAMSPLYSNAELVVEQSISLEEPAKCVLEVQLSKTDSLRINVEPVSGSLILSPVSERINRLQLDLARSKGLVDEFVSRISSLRSSTAETNLIKALPNSQWQRLDGIRVSLPEAEKLFGQAVSRVSCIRLPEWTQEWMVVITQTTSGDLWWLTQSARSNSIIGSRTTKLVESHPLYMVGSPSPAYLERLADYATGVIALQCNAEFLNKNKFRWRLSDIPVFDGESRLPSLQFSRTPVSISSPKESRDQLVLKESKLHDVGSVIHLTYHGMGRKSRKVIMVAKFNMAADPIVLQDLVSSKLDQSVAIIPTKQQLMIKLESDTGMSVIDSVVSKISHLENIVACAAAVKKSQEHTLQSLSLSSITILYHKQPELGLHIDFGKNSNEFSARFLPAATNSQRHLSEWVVKTMKRKGHNSNQNLANIFIVLRMTQPILSYLQRLQGLPTGENTKVDNHLRIHVLHRQPTAYGLHYFASSSNFDRDDNEPSTPKKLLARFEILAMKRGDRLMWMVRPAIEEFNSYNRPSYTSQTLRERLDAEIFRKQSPLWLALDAGAACPSDKPEQLLSAIHEVIVDWAKDAVKPERAEQSIPNAVGRAAPDKKSNQTNRDNLVAQKTQNSQQRPNGVSKPLQQNNQRRPQNMGTGNMGIKAEVITLD